MINEEWNKTQNDVHFVAFYDMRAVTFVLPDEMTDVSIAGLQWFNSYTPIKPHVQGPTGQVIPIANLIRSDVKSRFNHFS